MTTQAHGLPYGRPLTYADLETMPDDRLARAGCPQYWVVDPDEPSITAWTLHDGEYIEAAHATGAEQFSVTEPFPVTLTPDSLVA